MSRRPTPVDDDLHAWVVAHGTREDALLARLREETGAMPQAGMQVAPEQGALLAMLVRLTGARTVVEVGTFTGYSSVCMARALPDGGHLHCLDVSAEFTDVARRYWAEAGVDDRITLHLAPALDTLAGLAGPVDMAFLDADKERYPAYYEALIGLLRPGGLLAVDNVLWHGGVADPDDQRDTTQAIRELAARASTDERVDVAMVTAGDGLLLVRKR
ncbi:MAG: O-methyltransferase [Myxococcales bacterium]|nr:O-methyltransferase [Myxococcales bacterium]MCB9694047.1 O-methyltransferase [Alphaproteobacteria bacterium]